MTLPTSPTIGFTLPQRGVFFGVTTVAEMLALAAKVTRVIGAPIEVRPFADFADEPKH